MTTVFVTASFAGCFTVDMPLTTVAQKVRLESKYMGWSVGISKSLAVAGIIKAKQEIFPDGTVRVCIKEQDGDLKFSMQSDSIEEGSEKKWYFLTGSKSGWF